METRWAVRRRLRPHLLPRPSLKHKNQNKKTVSTIKAAAVLTTDEGGTDDKPRLKHGERNLMAAVNMAGKFRERG